MEEDIKKLIEKNLELTEEIHKMTVKINRFIFWSRIMGFIKILIIVIPLVLGIIYLPPLLKGVFSQYQELLGGQDGISGMGAGLGDIDIEKLSPELKSFLK